MNDFLDQVRLAVEISADKQRIRVMEPTIAAAGIWIDANRRGASDEYREAAISLLSEIDALLKGTIHERPQASVTEPDELFADDRAKWAEYPFR